MKMRMFCEWSVVFALALATGACVGTNNVGRLADNTAISADCDVEAEDGCFTFDILSVYNDQRHPLLVGLDQPPADENELYYRTVKLGPLIYAAYKDGEIKASAPGTAKVFMWNTDDTPTGFMAGYGLTGVVEDNKVKQVRRDVTEIDPSIFKAAFDPAYAHLGMPQRAFDVDVQIAGGSLQIPESMIKHNTYILICSPDGTDYIWLNPVYLRAMLDDGWKYTIPTFPSKTMGNAVNQI